MATIFDDFSSIGALDNAPTSDSNGVWESLGAGAITKSSGVATVVDGNALYRLPLVGQPDLVQANVSAAQGVLAFRIRNAASYLGVVLSVNKMLRHEVTPGPWTDWLAIDPYEWRHKAGAVSRLTSEFDGVIWVYKETRFVHYSDVPRENRPPYGGGLQQYIKATRNRLIFAEQKDHYQQQASVRVWSAGGAGTQLRLLSGGWKTSPITGRVSTEVEFTPSGFDVTVEGIAPRSFTEASNQGYFGVGIGGEVGASFTNFTVEITVVPPNAPTLTPLVGVQPLDRVIRLGWTPSFGVPGDTQQSAEVRWRQDAGAWATISVGGGRAYTDIAADTFVSGQVEWQARTENQHSIWGPWSPSEFFGVAPSPPGPQILDPINNSQIILPSYPVVWTAEGQQSFQIRRVADLAGSPDLGTIYFDTGEIVSTEREYEVAFPVEGQFEHLQLRIRDQGIWSGWDSVRVEVTYSPPSTPEVDLMVLSYRGLWAGFRVLGVHVQEPGTPDVERLEVWRRETVEDGLGVRLTAGIPANTVFDDWAVASGVDYEYRVRVVGVNQSTAWSEWVGAQPQSVVETVGGGLLWLTGRDW